MFQTQIHLEIELKAKYKTEIFSMLFLDTYFNIYLYIFMLKSETYLI